MKPYHLFAGNGPLDHLIVGSFESLESAQAAFEEKQKPFARVCTWKDNSYRAVAEWFDNGWHFGPKQTVK